MVYKIFGRDANGTRELDEAETPEEAQGLIASYKKQHPGMKVFSKPVRD